MTHEPAYPIATLRGLSRGSPFDPLKEKRETLGMVAIKNGAFLGAS